MNLLDNRRNQWSDTRWFCGDGKRAFESSQCGLGLAAVGGVNSGEQIAGLDHLAFLEKGLGEIKRVLKPGGRLVVLEFSKPKASVVKQLYNVYMKVAAPAIEAIEAARIAEAVLPPPRLLAPCPRHRPQRAKRR